ncbi:hypothetical protein DBB33_03625 [Chromobacterium haemolyticum]|uniref:Uncharacterized protein n=1 Tax=Chromobacterium rhizoryzae TaxID=1778675 RepID=A0AAD0W6T0_9NEIS|nr:hypothetical protein D1345_04230 [Chromobacterium rhizoryzae]PTU68594.1 hypothetical protein DBB33_03625 [Chromobacterium haemolyticum]
MQIQQPAPPRAAVAATANRRLEPVYDLLRVGDTALKPASKCSCTTRTFRFLSRFRLVSP